MTELARVVGLLRQGREARRRELAPAAGAPAPGADLFGQTFAQGDRVFDRVTGETGVVIGGQRENLISQPAERANG